MPKPSLTAAFVRSVSEPGKYHDGKGTGLYLRVDRNGSRFWVQRVTIRGKRCELGLGSFPTVSLVEAREQAAENKKLVRSGRDPLAEKQTTRRILTFEEAARKVQVEVAPTYKNPKDAAAFLSTLETYMFPRIGAIPLAEVTSADVRRAILAARERAPGVAHKLVHRTSRVFKWGIAEGMCSGNPSTSEALALPRVQRSVQHRKALPYQRVAECIEVVNASNAAPTTKLALEFLILTATRSRETREASWREFRFGDIDASTSATWVIPKERAKMKREHLVPLSRRVVEILREAEALSNGSQLVFPGMKVGRPISDMTLSKLVKELGFEADVHGFRTSFRTWTQEQTNFPREVAEAALAHRVGDAAEQAYARSDLLEKRRMMMESWAKYVSLSSSEIIDLKARL